MQRRVCNIESAITFARKAENLMFTCLYCYVIYVLYFSPNFPDPLLQQNYLASKIKPLGKVRGCMPCCHIWIEFGNTWSLAHAFLYFVEIQYENNR